MRADQWRSAALAALWGLVVLSLALPAINVWRSGPPGDFAILGIVRSVLMALVTAFWTTVFARYTLSRSNMDAGAGLRALQIAFPWLTALRLALWFLEVLSLSGDGATTASPVALTALLTIELGFILGKNAVYGTLARVAASPGDAVGRARLVNWLNYSAALSLAIGVVNLVPIAGLGGARDPILSVFYGLHAALDVLSTVLALRAVQTMGERLAR